MKLALVILLIFLSETAFSDDQIAKCSEILVDQVTEVAFGDRGEPFTGKVDCYYDKEKAKIKSERIFSNGMPISTHRCFETNGDLDFYIKYENGKRFKRGSVLNYVNRGKKIEVLCEKPNAMENLCVKSNFSNCNW